MTTSTPPSTPRCDPAFPPELEREIFETAAKLYPQTIPSLFLVAHRVHEWRIQYKTITMRGIKSTCSWYALKEIIRSDLRPKSFLRDVVRHIFLPPWDLTPSEEDLLQVFSVCTQIQSLALFLPIGAAPLPSTVQNAISAMKLQRLSLVSLEPLRDFLHLHRRMFGHVTHLELWELGVMSWAIILDLFPSVTHIAISAHKDCHRTVPSAGFGLSEEALAQCPQINVIIAIGRASIISDLVTGLGLQWQDPRLVFVKVDADASWLEYEWTRGLAGEPDFWAEAETFVAKRRREKDQSRVCASLRCKEGSFIEMYE
ncbi:hypothetical protein R3P38DRAFT_3255262 [Favolaschia claudopus]|uniref:Uncharacterized protein n=1 Tax=Favolaschia claudopus TaxID=2862362 RepID=A0AAW0DGQ9_9AGAR